MMIHTRTIVAALVFLTALIPATALAQIVRDTGNHAPPVAADGDDPAVPERPSVPEGLAARVAALRETVVRTEDCYTYYGDRVEHVASRSCGRLYAQLAAGGAAAAHAVGAVFERSRDSEGALRGSEGEFQRGPRLVQVMAATRAPEAVPYLLRYLAHSARRGGFQATENEIVRQLSRIAGHDVAPVAPWDQAALGSQGARGRLTSAWLRWWDSHRGEGLDRWAADGAARASADMQSTDPAVRFAAMQSLVNAPAHRAEVTAALGEMLARPDLPARAAVYLRRWAQRGHIEVAAPTALAAGS